MFWFILKDTGLHYDRYLKEVVMTLEEDPAFRKKLEEANVTDIKVFKYVLCIVKGANRKKIPMHANDAHWITHCHYDLHW